jgi:regulator of RNase E activity RraA
MDDPILSVGGLGALGDLSVPNVSDALDALGLDAACRGILSLGSEHSLPMIGPAFTVQFEDVPAGVLAPAADYIDDIPAGCVIVLANQGRLNCTVWGDILAFRALQLGLRGTVIDGCCRDIDTVRSAGYPLFARGIYMRSGRGRVRMVSAGRPVSIAGVTVHCGDVMWGDANGVLAIPRDHFRDVVGQARAVKEREDRIRAALDSGSRLSEARSRHGYN